MWRRGGVESWCDGDGGNPGMGHKVIKVMSVWWWTELQTERKKESVGNTEDLPGVAFLTNRGCVSVHRLGKHQQNGFFREASLYGFWSLLKSVKTKKVISVLLMFVSFSSVREICQTESSKTSPLLSYFFPTLMDFAAVRERGAGVTIQSDLEGILNLKVFSCRYTSTLTNP